MSKQRANLHNPENQELSFDDNTSAIEFLRKNLAQLLVDTEKVKVELDKFQKDKKRLLEHKFSCLVPGILLEPLPEEMDLLPRINQVTSQAEELISRLSKLNKACEETKSVTAKLLMGRTDQDATMSEEDLEKIIEERKKAVEQCLLEAAIERKPQSPTAMVQQMESLNLARRTAIDCLIHMMMGMEIDKEDPTK